MKTLILSDIHGNLPALEAILHEEPHFDQCLFLGDVVDYGPFPKECILALKYHMDIGVIGNHDNAIVHDVDCGCRGDFKVASDETRAWHKTLLATYEIDFLASLSKTEHTWIEGLRIHMAHAAPNGDLARYLDQEALPRAVSGIDADLVLLGHTHVQYEAKIGRKLVVNPGSVGLARDGGKACYALLVDGQIQLKRLEYDVQRTISAILEAPLSEQTRNLLTAVLRGQRV